jgi:hypothetical protein
MRIDSTPCRDFKPCRFGRKVNNVAPAIAARSTLSDDIRLFAITFAGGFLFMTIFLA